MTTLRKWLCILYCYVHCVSDSPQVSNPLLWHDARLMDESDQLCCTQQQAGRFDGNITSSDDNLGNNDVKRTLGAQVSPNTLICSTLLQAFKLVRRLFSHQVMHGHVITGEY